MSACTENTLFYASGLKADITSVFCDLNFLQYGKFSNQGTIKA